MFKIMVVDNTVSMPRFYFTETSKYMLRKTDGNMNLGWFVSYSYKASVPEQDHCMPKVLLSIV